MRKYGGAHEAARQLIRKRIEAHPLTHSVPSEEFVSPGRVVDNPEVITKRLSAAQGRSIAAAKQFTLANSRRRNSNVTHCVRIPPCRNCDTEGGM